MKLLFGCGYLGSRVAARWHRAGDEVTVVTRNRDRVAELESQGFQSIMADVTDPKSLRNLPAAEIVLFAVGFDRRSEQSIRDVYAGGVDNVLHSLPAETGRFIYVSTTGVYGDTGGQSVDEHTPPHPEREAGRASLVAEQVLRNHAFGRRGIILRLAGIYGPGRIPFIDRLQAGESLPVPKDGNLNLIYVDDAAACILAAERLVLESVGPRIYCISDGCPVPRGEFYREAARVIGTKPPTFSRPDPDSPRVARAGSDKRIDNSLMLGELRVNLSCPSYRQGLVKILRNEGEGPTIG